MAFIVTDNFLWHSDIDAAFSSEKKTAPFINLYNSDPYIFWETEGCTDEYFDLDLSATDNRKPFVFCFYNVNWTKDAIVSLLASSSGSFASPTASETRIVHADLYDYSNTLLGFNKAVYVAPDILALGDSSKAHVRFRIQDSTNPDGFLRTGIVFVGSALHFNMRAFALDEGVTQDIINTSTRFYSLNKQLHTRFRKTGTKIKASISDSGLYSKNAIRRIIKQLGMHRPAFLSINEYDNNLDGMYDFSTQVYYGRFSQLPNIKENFYYEGFKKDGNFEDYGSITYDFEFAEIV